jgi:hypothetical protein
MVAVVDGKHPNLLTVHLLDFGCHSIFELLWGFPDARNGRPRKADVVAVAGAAAGPQTLWGRHARIEDSKG